MIGAIRMTIIDDIIMQRIIIAKDKVLTKLYEFYRKDSNIVCEDNSDVVEIELSQLVEACEILGVDLVVICDSNIDHLTDAAKKFVFTEKEFCKEYSVDYEVGSDDDDD